MLDYAGFEQSADALADDEYYDAQSRCFLIDSSGYTNNKCFRAECSQDKKSIKVSLRTGQTVNCTKSKEAIQVNGFSYSIICPDIDDFCEMYPIKCPNNCLGKGLCVGNGECFCFDDLKGEDCSVPLTDTEKKQREDEIWAKRTSDGRTLRSIALLVVFMVSIL